MKKKVKSRRAAKRSSGGLPPKRLQRIFDFVEKNLGSEIELAEMAAAAEMSLHYFAKMFKDSTGVTPHQFVTQRRIEKAKHLLIHSYDTVSEISLTVGFADQSHFTNVFRKLVGTTPKRWREQDRPAFVYRRKAGDKLWHCCSDCSSWPQKDFFETNRKPAVELLCNECRAKLVVGDCRC